MKITANPWIGALPAIGDYLKSPRGRFAYRVCGLAVNAVGTVDQGEVTYEVFKVAFMVERIPAAQLPPRARVHLWKWANRAPKERRC